MWSEHDIVARVYDISREGECPTAFISCRNILHPVTPVNYCILTCGFNLHVIWMIGLLMMMIGLKLISPTYIVTIA